MIFKEKIVRKFLNLILVADYSNKITLFNAKEKLLSHVKILNIKGDMSNKWNFMIDLDRVKEEENEDLDRVILLIEFFLNNKF